MARWAGFADAMDSATEESSETMVESDVREGTVSSARFFRMDLGDFEEEAMADLKYRVNVE